jgi:hypothetical protein
MIGLQQVLAPLHMLVLQVLFGRSSHNPLVFYIILSGYLHIRHIRVFVETFVLKYKYVSLLEENENTQTHNSTLSSCTITVLVDGGF